MNWTNYDLLVKHLETMPPEMFDYYNPNAELEEEPSCVACQCRLLSGNARPHKYNQVLDKHLWDSDVIETFLAVDCCDAMYLYVPGDNGTIGAAGIQNALSRLRTVAAKYPRPSTPKPVAPFMADDAAFLAACRAMASQPIEVDA